MPDVEFSNGGFPLTQEILFSFAAFEKLAPVKGDFTNCYEFMEVFETTGVTYETLRRSCPN